MDLAGRQIGNYIAKSELGSGGMGVVYLCEHPLIKRRVAAKVLHEELAASEEIVRRLFAEAKAANEISSEHIIEVLDFGRLDDGTRELVYLLMEFLEGEGLGHRLWRTGLTIDESLHIVSQCCEALEASHKAGIVHRDLKPENIFLLERRGDPNFVKILDFGIAKVCGNPSTKTRTGVLLGTPAYMSPEQCRGSGSVDARADVYSLGIVLYELTTGDVPFTGNGYGQVLLAQMTEQPRPPSTLNKDLPKVVEDIVMRALAKDPAERFQTMAEFGRALAAAQVALGSTSPIAQIPRKGLHNRETFVANSHKSKSVTGILAAVAPTPVDAGVGKKMAQAAEVAPTQMMAAVDESEAAAIAAVASSPGSSVVVVASANNEPATVFEREVPAHVAAAALQHAATGMAERPVLPAQVEPARPEPPAAPKRDGSGSFRTGPQGMVAPPRIATPAAGTPTVLSAQAPTVVRQRPGEVDDALASERADRPSRSGLYIILGALVIAALGIAIAFAVR